MLTIALQGEGNASARKTLTAPEAFQNEIILLMRFLKQQPEFEPCIKVSTGSHAVAFAGCVSIGSAL